MSLWELFKSNRKLDYIWINQEMWLLKINKTQLSISKNILIFVNSFAEIKQWKL